MINHAKRLLFTLKPNIGNIVVPDEYPMEFSEKIKFRQTLRDQILSFKGTLVTVAVPRDLMGWLPYDLYNMIWEAGGTCSYRVNWEGDSHANNSIGGL